MNWKPEFPERFGDMRVGWDLLFSCRRGNCHRRARFERKECIERWGREGRVADVVARLRCERCRTPGAYVEVVRGIVETPSIGELVRAKLEPIDRLARDIADVKPAGTVS